MKASPGVCWAMTAYFWCAASLPGALESADAVFAFNGDAKSQSGSMEGIERFAGDAGYIPYSAADENNLVAYFNGASAIEIPDLAHVDLAQGLTIAMRFQIEGGNCALVSQRGEPAHRVFQIECESHGKANVFQWRISLPGGRDFELKTPEIPGENWMTGVFVYDPGVSASIYINGERVAHEEGDPVPVILRQIPDLSWFVGAQPYPTTENLSNHLRGYVDVLAVWSRALSPEEAVQVSEKMQNGL